MADDVQNGPEDGSEDLSAAREAPLGSQSGRVDSAGRLKVSVEVERFLKGVKLFITSLDNGITAKLIPEPIWQDNEKMLAEDQDDPDGAEQILMQANYWGGRAELDKEGRVLLPTLLRRKMGIEGQPVVMWHMNGSINVHTVSHWEQSNQVSPEDLKNNLRVRRRKGLKV